MEHIHILTQDDGACNGGTIKKVKISDKHLPYELNRFFGWRYDLTVDRLYRQDPLNYDKFIKYLSQKGYA